MFNEIGTPAAIPKRVTDTSQNEIKIFAGFFVIFDKMFSVCYTNSVLFYPVVSTSSILKIAEGKSEMKKFRYYSSSSNCYGTQTSLFQET